MSDPDKSEDRDDRRYGKLLDVYIPIQYRPHGAIFGAFELCQTYNPVAREVASLQRAGYAVLGGGLFALYLLLFGIVPSGSNAIVEQ